MKDYLDYVKSTMIDDDNEIDDVLVCDYCNETIHKGTEYFNFEDGYKNFCSKECAKDFISDKIKERINI